MTFLLSVYAAIPSIKESGCLAGDGGIATIKCAEVIFERLLYMASALVLLVLFIMLVVGSFKYLTSGGDAEKLAGAQNTLKFAIFGTMLFIGSFLILNIIQLLFLGNTDAVKKGAPSLFKFDIPVYK